MKDQEIISLSVIVPCYNVEKYLDKSLSCLENQWGGRTDYEIIFINDASTDGTIQKLNRFKERYPDNVVIIDKQQNEGVSAGRNGALDIARGTWITFFDPDDVFVKDGYYQLLTLAEKEQIDILSFGIAIVEGNADIDMPVNDGNNDIVWRGTSLDFMSKYHFGICTTSLYRRNVIVEHRFPKISICEDTVFSVSILLGNWRMARTDAKMYYYLYRPTSATNTKNAARLSIQCDDIFEAISSLYKLESGQREDVKQRITDHLEKIFSPNLMTRLLLSNKCVSDIKTKVDALKRMSLFPLCSVQGGKVMTEIMNLVYGHLWLLPLFRPIYRMYRYHHP